MTKIKVKGVQYVSKSSMDENLYTKFRAEPNKYCLHWKDMNSRYFEGYLVYELFDAKEGEPKRKLYCKLVIDRSDHNKVTRAKFYYEY